jgi:hypothetical protein
LQVVAHNSDGSLEVRLINPNATVSANKSKIVKSIMLMGFNHNDSDSEIELNFVTPLELVQSVLSDKLNLSVINNIAGSTCEYSVSNKNICVVNKDSSDGFNIHINPLAHGNATITVKL